MSDDFLHTTLPVLDKRIHRLGLACNYGLDDAGIEAALEDRGMGFVFWTPRQKHGEAPLRKRLKAARDEVVLMSGPTTAHWGGNITRYVDKTLRRLDIDHIDVGMVFWVGITASLTEDRMAEMMKLRDQGKVKAIGCSIHDRPRAGELAASSELDLLMVRYNAAHPGAERDIFPRLDPDRPRIVLAYTATRWRKLLKRPRGWQGEVMTAAHCYRFCLSNPSVHAVLGGPKTLAQLDENLEGLARGQLTPDEEAWVREYGRIVHG